MQLACAAAASDHAMGQSPSHVEGPPFTHQGSESTIHGTGSKLAAAFSKPSAVSQPRQIQAKLPPLVPAQAKFAIHTGLGSIQNPPQEQQQQPQP